MHNRFTNYRSTSSAKWSQRIQVKFKINIAPINQSMIQKSSLRFCSHQSFISLVSMWYRSLYFSVFFLILFSTNAVKSVLGWLSSSSWNPGSLWPVRKSHSKQVWVRKRGPGFPKRRNIYLYLLLSMPTFFTISIASRIRPGWRSPPAPDCFRGASKSFLYRSEMPRLHQSPHKPISFCTHALRHQHQWYVSKAGRDSRVNRIPREPSLERTENHCKRSLWTPSSCRVFRTAAHEIEPRRNTNGKLIFLHWWLHLEQLV